MARRQRNRLAVDERRAQLLEFGRSAFSRRPYDAISIDEIAKEAGVSKGLLYHYFDSKRGFYVETVRASVEEMRALTEPDPSLPPLERLDASLDAYLEYIERRGSGYALLLHSGVGSDPEVLALIEDQRQVVIGRVLDGLGLSEARPPIRIALRGWLGFIDAACIDWVEHRDVPRTSLRALLAGSLQAALLTAIQMDPELHVALPELDPDTSPSEAAARIAFAIAEAGRDAVRATGRNR